MRQAEHLFAISCAGSFTNLEITKYTLQNIISPKFHVWHNSLTSQQVLYLLFAQL